jgi:hypothetical protein
MSWQGLAGQFQPGMRRSMQAVEILANAYNNVFMGNATKAEQQMVLADLENESGFVKVVIPGPGVSLDFEGGKRYMFGRIFRFLSMSFDEHNELHKAARQEALADSQEGNII